MHVSGSAMRAIQKDISIESNANTFGGITLKLATLTNANLRLTDGPTILLFGNFASKQLNMDCCILGWQSLSCSALLAIHSSTGRDSEM